MQADADNLQQRLAVVQTMVFDVDGVLTDGGLILDNCGKEYKRFHSRDGHGIRMLLDHGIRVAVITGRQSGVVEHRCTELGIDYVYQGYRDKRPAFAALMAELSLPADLFAYMGDDIVDLAVMRRVGVAMAVADAHPFVQRHAHWISQYRGGRGAAREACEALLRARGQLGTVLESYL